MKKYIKNQISICEKYGAEYVESPNDLKLGIAQNMRSGIVPINGLRMSVEKGTTGWYIWAGEEMRIEPDFFLPLHVQHIDEWAPEIKKYLGLPPGWRFLIAGNYEDVWYDPDLLNEDSEEDLDAWEEQMLKEHGWYMHYILAEDNDGIHANYHTHGLAENYNHRDLQIVLNIDMDLAEDIFHIIIEEIKLGNRFEEGIEYPSIIEGDSIIMKSFVEMDREVLRVLLPNERGILPTVLE
ncbi:lipoyl synthase [Bacillus cereus]|uniref:Lipoyl synthase n=1 Tax=Bacillus cereus TaxID=1396 RepID=A0A2B3U3W8_BACCE|nr:DUF4262 domain-containing protein [Bacillus cereus]PFU44221.1 lipoyl synthase [Bacillus cereus]